MELEAMRSTVLLTVVAVLASYAARADVKRLESIPEPLWGSWAPSADACSKTDKAVLELSARSYVSPAGRCSVDWVAETAGARGSIYSARLRCSGTTERPQKTNSNSVLVPKDADHLSIGADFSSLKPYLRCPASAAAAPQ
jgi:hypothetical protein